MKTYWTTLITGLLATFIMTHLTLGITYAENNKFGMHIAVPSDEDINRVAELVNSNGGEYGYITFVIQENNRDTNYWQQIFDKLRKLKLIPIVRIATQPDGDNWRAPKVEDAEDWARFLNSLNWVTKDRYVILFNEPNHATEWGGKVDAKGYGRVSAEFAKHLKSQSNDFYIMLAGLDLSAPEAPPRYSDAYIFFQTEIQEFCNVLKAKDLACSNHIDGISSHSYPNPGFVGSPYDTGRTTIRGYQYEIQWYKDYLGRELPVFITETGWDAFRLGQDAVASYYTTAFQQIWLEDSRIKAVTPFVLNYQGDPFLPFSFLTQGGAEPYPKYRSLQNLSKLKGTPDIRDTANLAVELPKQVVEDSEYDIPVTIENTGQAIWGVEHKLHIVISPKSQFQLTADPIAVPDLNPFQKATIPLRIKTGKGSSAREGDVSVALSNGEVAINTTTPRHIRMELRPNLSLTIPLFSKGLSSDKDFEIQLFNVEEQLVYKKSSLSVKQGKVKIERIPNIIPGRQYRIVILKPYYLPRQLVYILKVGDNKLEFEPMLPFDYNLDGKLSIGDALSLFLKKDAGDRGFLQKMRMLFP